MGRGGGAAVNASATTPLGGGEKSAEIESLFDGHGRRINDLRVSVTDLCNLRCQYCMPEREYTWLPRRDVLDFEEIARLVEVFTSAGVGRVRLTGGEPLVRRDLPRLVELLAGNAAIRDLALTTNGVLLEENA
ncbi:MAG: radical SAM protein, partial [Thermoleophilia bacterium]|nr:radical SAM protein [Thermoleophilia bacterium]